MRKIISLRLLSRYFSSRCTEKEKKKVEAWIDSSEKNKEIAERLRNVWQISGHLGEEWDMTRPLQKLTATMRETSLGTGEVKLYRIPTRSNDVTFKLKTVFQIAAVLVVLAGSFYAIQFLKARSIERDLSRHRFVIEELSTKPGQQVSFRFDDGTKVVLNSASRLRYNGNPEGSRDVYLEGEAYFEVVHSDAHPFFVHSVDGTIKDIGTKFDVKAWSDDKNMQVTVIEGKVSVKFANQVATNEPAVEVSRNQYCVLNSHGIVVPPTYTDVSSRIDWMEGKLVFHNDPVSEVIKQIRRNFGVYCFVSDSSILSKKITTSFDSHDPIKQVLDIIALSLDLTYKVSKDSVLFMPSKAMLNLDGNKANSKDTSYEKGKVDH